MNPYDGCHTPLKRACLPVPAHSHSVLSPRDSRIIIAVSPRFVNHYFSPFAAIFSCTAGTAAVPQSGKERRLPSVMPAENCQTFHHKMNIHPHLPRFPWDPSVFFSAAFYISSLFQRSSPKFIMKNCRLDRFLPLYINSAIIPHNIELYTFSTQFSTQQKSFYINGFHRYLQYMESRGPAFFPSLIFPAFVYITTQFAYIHPFAGFSAGFYTAQNPYRCHMLWSGRTPRRHLRGSDRHNGLCCRILPEKQTHTQHYDLIRTLIKSQSGRPIPSALLP